MKKINLFFLSMFLLFFIVGCGQSGRLYLPGQEPHYGNGSKY